MHVRAVRVKKFRHLVDVELGPFASPGAGSSAIALAGPNGGGKSSILELLGYALSNAWSLSWTLHRTFPDHAFEVALGLGDADMAVIKSWVEDTDPPATDREAAEALLESRVVYRGYNMPDGVSHADATNQNRMFNIATRALKDHYQRSVGLFLRADRSYPNKNFDRNKILQWDSIKSTNHRYSIAFNTSELQYQDMYDHLVQRRYHYYRELGEYHHREATGQLPEGAQKPADPLGPYDNLLNRLFPEYRFQLGESDIPGDLFISIGDEVVLPFRDLSSGEKEVFFILASLIRHEVRNAILVVDEPELHLHPEFGRLLVRELIASAEGNQIWLATHNPEVMDEVGVASTIHVSRDPQSRLAVTAKASDEPEAARMLRELFGFSGYVGVGRSLVFLEGTDSSTDRKVFSRLLPPGSSPVRFIPAGGVQNLSRINAAVLRILEDGIGQMVFYLIRDRDYLTDEEIEKYNNHPSQRIRVLERHQIENYLLCPEAIGSVLDELYNQALTTDQIAEDLREAARSVTGEVAAGLVRQQVADIWVPEEVLPSGFLRGSDVLDGQSSETLRIAVRERTAALVSGLQGALDPGSIDAIVEDSLGQTAAWIEDGGWRARFPGKRILQAFASRRGLGSPVVFQNALVNAIAAESPRLVPDELLHLLEEIGSGTAVLGTPG